MFNDSQSRDAEPESNAIGFEMAAAPARSSDHGCGFAPENFSGYSSKDEGKQAKDLITA